MQIKCEYCGGFIEDTDAHCGHCGAANNNLKRTTEDTPKTIAQLQAWYEARHLPPKETTRFFIGENYTGPRAFGIYQENGEFIVYKNKDDGTRAIRYQGKDEAYAVNELFLKLKSEILNQKAHNIGNGNVGANNAPKSLWAKIKESVFSAFCVVCVIAAVGSWLWSGVNAIKDWRYAGKYYRYNDTVYYCDSYSNDDWYYYDDTINDYTYTQIPQEVYDNISDYKYSINENWDNTIERFEDTEMGQYVEAMHSESDSDSSYDWGSSDSWDSGSSDWGSDW